MWIKHTRELAYFVDYILFYYFTEFYDIICDDVVRIKSTSSFLFLLLFFIYILYFLFMSSLTIPSDARRKSKDPMYFLLFKVLILWQVYVYKTQTLGGSTSWTFFFFLYHRRYQIFHHSEQTLTLSFNNKSVDLLKYWKYNNKIIIHKWTNDLEKKKRRMENLFISKFLFLPHRWTPSHHQPYVWCFSSVLFWMNKISSWFSRFFYSKTLSSFSTSIFLLKQIAEEWWEWKKLKGF